MTATTTSPFDGAPGEIGVGASDAMLLVVSVAGFVFLAATVYGLIVVRYGKRHDDDDDGAVEKQDLDQAGYEQRLIRSDPSTLTRAERRARARAIMKEQRRADPTNAAADGGGGVVGLEGGQQGGEIRVDDGDGDGHDDDDGGARHAVENTVVKSRKERQRAAKAAERDERRLFEDERREQQRRQQEEAQRRKRERARLEERRREEERRRRQEEKDASERAKIQEFNTFLSPSSSAAAKHITVEEWIATLNEGSAKSRVLVLSEIAETYGVSVGRVRDRIQQLVREQRVAGAFERDGSVFVYVPEILLSSVAAAIRKKLESSGGELSSKEIADLMNDALLAAGEGIAR